MRRILLLITDLKIGGTPTVVRELAVRLRSKEVHIEVACLDWWGPVADQLAEADVTVTALDAGGAGDWGAIERLIRLIRRERFDTVFSFLVHANAAAAIASCLCRQVRFFQSIQTTQRKPRWHWMIQSVAGLAAEKIIVPSPSVARAARDWAQTSEEKIVVIPNAVAIGENRGRKTGAPFVIGFIGRLDPVKRIGDLLAAVELLGGAARLEIFGEGSQRKAIEADIERLGIGSLVKLHGVIPRPQEALEQIDLLVLPSEAEGFGLVLIEAMAASVPVVASDAPGICDVVEDGKSGLLVPVGKPDRLAEAIRRVMADANLRRNLIDGGRRRVEEAFTWDKVLWKYRKVLELDAPD